MVQYVTHRIGGNHERRDVNNFSFSIAKINVFDCQNRYNGNRKRLILVRRLPFWQSKTLYLAIVNHFSENERSFAIAAYPVCVCFLVLYQTFPCIGSSGSRYDMFKTDCDYKMSEISNIACRWVKTMPEVLKPGPLHVRGNFVFSVCKL